jgi:hypothetical protein
MAPKIVDLRSKKPARSEPVSRAHAKGGGERPSSPLRAKRRRKRLIALGIFLLLVLLLALGASYAAHMPQLRIAAIEIGGEKEMPEQLVADRVREILSDDSWRFIPRDSILFYNKEAIQRAVVADFPRLRFASVGRESWFSNTLVVTIDERSPLARWCPSATLGTEVQACFVLDETGFIYAEDSATAVRPSSEYVFSGGIPEDGVPIGRVFSPGHLPGLLALLERLADAGFAAQGASIENEQDFLVPLDRGFSIKASFGSDVGGLVRNLELVLNSETLQGRQDDLEYVDLRFGNRVYYKLKGEAEVGP